ncbi:MAG: hypothetical protein IPG34_15770 [Rhodocyclaceae bacterium]|nr:hypothetical protein [Rhodocyclaceae bacterium]
MQSNLVVALPGGVNPQTAKVAAGLEGIREAARRERRMKFVVLLHHVTLSLLVESSQGSLREAEGNSCSSRATESTTYFFNSLIIAVKLGQGF